MKNSKWSIAIAVWFLIGCFCVTQAQVADSTSEEEEKNVGPPPYPGAQQKWEYKFYGFSPDLSTAAFEQTGSSDYNWSTFEFYVVGVNKNNFSTRPIRYSYEDDLPDSITKLVSDQLTRFQLRYKKGFTKYEIDPGKSEFGIKIETGNYKLKLLQTDVGENKIFELQLIDLSNSKIRILQKDSKLPVSRGAVKRYRLRDAYVQGKKLAVILELDMESYEIESYWYYPTKYMIVTGSLDVLPIN